MPKAEVNIGTGLSPKSQSSVGSDNGASMPQQATDCQHIKAHGYKFGGMAAPEA
jgi:hypothetical protein